MPTAKTKAETTEAQQDNSAITKDEIAVATVNINDVKREWKEFDLVAIQLAKDFNDEGERIPQDLTKEFITFWGVDKAQKISVKFVVGNDDPMIHGMIDGKLKYETSAEVIMMDAQLHKKGVAYSYEGSEFEPRPTKRTHWSGIGNVVL